MLARTSEVKVLRDPIHGYVHIDLKVVWDCLNAREFQRLRRIHQLGGDFQVYHTAEHTRFSHSLGVYEIVRRMVREIPDIAESFSEYEKCTAMLAGLLHDIGFLELWKDGQEQTEFLQEYETERYEKHVVSGYNLIKKMNIDQRIKQAVLTHHERVNGSGFPLQVMGDNINWISRILAVADTYDALTMRQGDKAGISAFEAIKKMEDEGYNRLDANYLMTFLKRIAETMIQRNVILNDGRMGRVVMINKYKLSCPLVQVGDTFVDLAKQSRYYIQEILEE